MTASIYVPFTLISKERIIVMIPIRHRTDIHMELAFSGLHCDPKLLATK